jgi:hypothetical protein
MLSGEEKYFLFETACCNHHPTTLAVAGGKVTRSLASCA